MSIIRSLQQYLGRYEPMRLQHILTDQPGPDPPSYAVQYQDSGVSSLDILGNRVYQNSYAFLAREQRGTEAQRQSSHDFLEGLIAWLEDRADENDLPDLPPPYRATGLNVQSGILLDIDEQGYGTYKVLIQLYLIKERQHD